MLTFHIYADLFLGSLSITIYTSVPLSLPYLLPLPISPDTGWEVKTHFFLEMCPGYFWLFTLPRMLESAYEFPPQNNLLDFGQKFENLCRLM